jgi:O-antigen/teichoic acid export membrane protein
MIHSLTNRIGYIKKLTSGSTLQSMIKAVMSHRLVRSGALYLATTLISGLIGFMVLPLMSHFLPVTDIGILGIFQILYKLLIPIMGLSMNAIIAKSYYSRSDRNSMIGSSQIFSSILFSAFLILASIVPGDWLLQWSLNRTLLLTTGFLAYLGINNAVFMTIYQLENKPLLWSVSSLCGMLTNLLITFMLLYCGTLNYWARIAGYLVSSVSVGAINVYLCSTLLKVEYRWNTAHFYYFLRLGTPLILIAIGTWGLYSLDRAFVQSFLGIDAVGYYTMAVALATPMQLATESMSRAWLPHAYMRIHNNESMKLFYQALMVMAAFTMVAFLLATVGKLAFKYLVDRKFALSIDIMPIIVAGFLINGFIKLMTPFLMHTEKVGLLSWVTLSGLAVNAVGNFILIPRIGLYGAASATLIAFTSASLFITIAVFKTGALHAGQSATGRMPL